MYGNVFKIWSSVLPSYIDFAQVEQFSEFFLKFNLGGKVHQYIK